MIEAVCAGLPAALPPPSCPLGSRGSCGQLLAWVSPTLDLLLLPWVTLSPLPLPLYTMFTSVCH